MTDIPAYDYIVIGAGSAGAVVANRLSADARHRVLLVEAGGEMKGMMHHMPVAWFAAAMNAATGWGYRSEPEPALDGRQVDAARGRVMGGSSSINGMMYVRGNPADYDGWGIPGWSYGDVLPYFKRSESHFAGASRWHGGDGPIAVSAIPKKAELYPRFLAGARALGYDETDDFNGARQDGFTLPDFAIRRGRRSGAVAGYIDPARERANLTIESGAHVTRIRIEGGRATGIDYRRGGEDRRADARAEVVLCGGTYNSPHLLLLSGIGPAEEVRAAGIDPIRDLPAVGRNLQEHVSISCGFRATQPVTFENVLRIDRMIAAALRWRMFGTGPLGGMPMAIQGFVRSRADLDRPDIQLLVTEAGMTSQPWFPGLKRGAGHQFTGTAALLHPESRGTVTLRSADPADAPRLLFNLLGTESDRRAAREAVALIRALFATPAVQEIAGDETAPGVDVRSDADIDAWLRDTVMTGAHSVGTCAMGTTATSVVDPKLRLRGIDGLRIADCSVVPENISGNTNAAAVMVGEKAADLILGLAAPAALSAAA